VSLVATATFDAESIARDVSDIVIAHGLEDGVANLWHRIGDSDVATRA